MLENVTDKPKEDNKSIQQNHIIFETFEAKASKFFDQVLDGGA